MKRMSIGTVAALGLAVAVAGWTPPLEARARDHEKVTITGCVVRGTSHGDGFLLANASEQTTSTTTTPTPTGTVVTSSTTTSMKPSRIIYWLDDDDDVTETYMGQQVEVVGEVEGDIDKGKIEIERENGMVELEINADGRKGTVKLAEVPSAVGTAGSVGDHETKIEYIVRKLDVKSARMTGATCQ